jgi:hypothetical protein
MTENNLEAERIKFLLERLARISFDSHWSHRASGVRGALLKALASYEQGTKINEDGIQLLIMSNFEILLKAAKKKLNVRILLRKCYQVDVYFNRLQAYFLPLNS